MPSEDQITCCQTSKQNELKLHRLQNRAARVLTFHGCRVDADAICISNQLGWKDLHTQCQIQKALMGIQVSEWSCTRVFIV